MRRTTSLTLATGVFLMTAAGAFAQEPETDQETQLPPDGTQFVYINSQQIIENAPGASEAQQTWQEELTRYQEELESLSAELDSLQQAYQQQEGMLSEEAREERQQEIVEKQDQLQERRAELDQQASQRQQELLNPILQEVQGIIEQVRQERGYTMVFDASAAGLLAADPGLDITDLVLQRMQDGSESTDAGAGAGADEGGSDADGA